MGTQCFAMPRHAHLGGVGFRSPCPISVCDGRNWLLEYAKKTHELKPIPEEKKTPDTETVVSAREIWFKYDKDLPDVVKGLSLGTAQR